MREPRTVLKIENVQYIEICIADQEAQRSKEHK
jgi:hypothetical protein